MKLIQTATLLVLAGSLTPVAAQFPGAFGHHPIPPGFSPPQGFGQPAAGLDLQTSEDDKGYYLTITTGQLQPAEVKVDIDQRSVIVRTEQSNSREVQQSSPPGQGYSSYSYSYSSSNSGFNRRLPLPGDADTGKATREDGDHQVTIFIPRRSQSGN